MFVRRVVVLSAVLALVSAGVGAGPDQTAGKLWNYMPSRETGVQAFRTAHSTWDGRGVIVAVLDTGIDALAPGLQKTSTGDSKLLEVRDFSTEGDWDTDVAEWDDAAGTYGTEDGLILRGAAALVVPPLVANGVHPVYIGVIAEKDFINNSSVNDLNDDGDTSDQFGFLVYTADRATVEAELGLGRGYTLLQGLNETAAATVAAERQACAVWLVVVDTNGDGDLADETPIRDYHINHDIFTLANDNAPDARSLMAWEVNVVANEDQLGGPLPPTAGFHFDDGSHGSHCAGIATGFGVAGQLGMDGGAPGAWLMSLKLGDNRLAGGATRTESMKKAYEYAAGFEEKYGVPVVINMSFGIDSVQEGDDTMGRWLDDLLAEHPTLYVCTSAGNSGPGLATVGLPATSRSVISSGAYLSPAMGRDLYNAELVRATMFNFSSRGGEMNKPDVVSPGSALSTVPGYVDGMARYNGTSMASPQTAGAVACLVSAAWQEGLDIHWGMVKRALIAGGSPVPGLSLTDQGGGLVTVGTTWELLEKLAASKSAHQVLWYDISTVCAFQKDGRSEAAYWRTPGGTPMAPEKITFTIKPIFHPDLGPDERDTFFRSFRFKSDADWLHLVSGDRYLRGDMGMTVACTYDAKQLSQPGLYSARIHARLDGGDLKGLAAREFALWNTVVIGDDFGPDSGYAHTYIGRDLAQSAVHRYYVNVPAGASAMRVRVEVSEDTQARDGAAVLTAIYDPEGKERGAFAGYARKKGHQIADTTVLAPELAPGTWEVNVASSLANLDLSDYRLTVSFDGYEVEATELGDLSRPAPGKPAAAEFTVTRVFPGTFAGRISAAMEGFEKTAPMTVSDTDTWEHVFTLDRTTPRAVFHLVMTTAVANLFTDCALNVLDQSGKALHITGFSGVEGDIAMTLPAGEDQGTYTLQVVGAFALVADSAEWGFSLRERYLFGQPVSGQVTPVADGPLKLYAGIPAALKLEFEASWPAAPDGMQPYGRVIFRDEKTTDRRPGDGAGRVVCEVPVGMND